MYGRRLASTRSSADAVQQLGPSTPIAQVPLVMPNASQRRLQRDPSASERIVHKIGSDATEDIRIGSVQLQRGAGATVSSAEKYYAREDDGTVLGPVGLHAGSGARSKSKDLVQASDYGYSKPKMKISSGVLGVSRVYGSMQSPKARRSEESQERSVKPQHNSPLVRNSQHERYQSSPEGQSCERHYEVG